MFKVIESVIKGDTGAIHKFINFRACLEPKHPPYLRTTQYPRPIALYRQSFVRVPGQITPCFSR